MNPLNLKHIGMTTVQVSALCLVWLLSDWLVSALHIPLPSNVFGMFFLLFLLLAKVVKVQWFKAGANWLIAEMLLFFIPAVIAIVNYQTLFQQQGMKIVLVIGVSTMFVLSMTALVVDIVYRYEIKKLRGHR
ncbi:CidA/LrgA family protein [Vibrio sp. 10N.261.46.E12]|uniref:CidA/LrgA family protein n=1 Tax=unclassified Vibrio TaxID=2614977 RepID=UPI000978A07D|nr:MULTISPECIES: CidA/LrgA family protein [unclassified Vibrio]OMO33721.1 Holin-like protein CidA [Vibrio sp. 10N.261.45.E1]PMJ36803.1 Holin-like protein CidA [Vibrio sp. 10N.286.45.B6]PML82905.1 Holin-like protein CidA [Vibrio sp. 10N.261.49.E11]PMM65711.1 Holin-like protein CidA [Vibrio sp. 10N.261.46.F12]PMM78991.1 Holin-like protein CidA [Vibrio sp. 10N.261.46.E8]